MSLMTNIRDTVMKVDLIQVSLKLCLYMLKVKFDLRLKNFSTYVDFQFPLSSRTRRYWKLRINLGLIKINLKSNMSRIRPDFWIQNSRLFPDFSTKQ